MMHLIWRRLRHYWRLNLGLLLCLTLASVLLIGLLGSAQVIASRTLHQRLGKASAAERNLLITGNRYTFNEDLYMRLHKRLGPVLRGRQVIRRALSPYTPQKKGQEVHLAVDPSFLDVYSFDHLSGEVLVVKGRLPEQVRLSEATDTWRPPPMEVVMGTETATACGCEIGQRLTGMDGYHRFDLVGIVEPIDPQEDIWGGDLHAFTITTVQTESGRDALTLPLIINPGTMQSNYPEQPIFQHEVSWRIILNHPRIDVGRVESLHADLLNFQTQFTTLGATTSTGLVDILGDFLNRYSRMRIVLNLLLIQSLTLIVFLWFILSTFLVTCAGNELSLMSDRGASAGEITQIFAWQYLLLAFPATLVFGPGMVWLILQGLDRSVSVTTSLPDQAWWLSGLVGAGCCLGISLLIYLATRRSHVGGLDSWDPVSWLSGLHERYIDLYLLVFGGLLYWQLNRSGSLVMRRLRNSELADPLMLISPFLVTAAAALVLLRIWPYLLRWGAHLCRRQRGWLFTLSLSRLASGLTRSSLFLLQISLTLGFIVFSFVLNESLASGGESMVAGLVADAFWVSTLVMFLLSIAVFSLTYVLAGQERLHQLSHLIALGLSERQITWLLFIESLPSLLLGVVTGVLIGISLSWMVIPYLLQSLGEVAGQMLPLNWPRLIGLSALLMLGYAVAELIILFALSRLGSNAVTRYGDVYG